MHRERESGAFSATRFPPRRGPGRRRTSAPGPGAGGAVMNLRGAARARLFAPGSRTCRGRRPARRPAEGAGRAGRPGAARPRSVAGPGRAERHREVPAVPGPFAVREALRDEPAGTVRTTGRGEPVTAPAPGAEARTAAPGTVGARGAPVRGGFAGATAARRPLRGTTGPGALAGLRPCLRSPARRRPSPGPAGTRGPAEAVPLQRPRRPCADGRCGPARTGPSGRRSDPSGGRGPGGGTGDPDRAVRRRDTEPGAGHTRPRSPVRANPARKARASVP